MTSADEENRRVRFLIALLLAVPVYGADLRILFIGNSLTYINDLPSMVRRIGEIDGREIETTMVAAPNYSLEDHLMSQRMAAEAIDGVLIPAGEAWYRIVKEGGGQMLYSKDGFHPTLVATYMVALATYRALVGPVPDAAVTMNGASRVADGDLGVTPRQLVALVKAVNR